MSVPLYVDEFNPRKKKPLGNDTKLMITEYFQRADMEVSHAGGALAALTGGVPRDCDDVVEVVCARVLQYVQNKRRGHKLVLPEASFRTFLTDVLHDRTPVTLAAHHGAVVPVSNPATSLSMPQLLTRAFGGEAAVWTQFYTTAKPMFQPLLDAVLARRKTYALSTYFFDPTPEAASTSGVGGGEVGGTGDEGGAKRKRCRAAHERGSARAHTVTVAPAASPGTNILTSGQLVSVRAETGEVDADFERMHRVMREKLVLWQQTETSPPPSPTLKAKPHVVKLSDSELFQLSVRAHSKTPSAGVLQLFAADTELSPVPPHYNPPFDRNDLFLTNLGDAQRLFAQEAAFTQAALRRKQEADFDGVFPDYPGVVIVCLRYTGQLELAGPVCVCTYVTWCTLPDLAPSSQLYGSTVFLDDVLSGRVRCNNMVTQMLACASHADPAMWKRRFQLERVDDTLGLITCKALPALVATLDACVEQNAGRGKRQDASGKTCIGLNLEHPHHARHRLIFESGSLDTYRAIQHCKQAKMVCERLFEKCARAAEDALDAAATLWHDLAMALSLSTSSYPRARDVVQSIMPLGKLFVTTLSAASACLKDVRVAYDKFAIAAKERKEKVDIAYAACRVQSYKQRVAGPDAGIVQMHAELQRGWQHEVADVSVLFSKHERLLEVRQCLVSLWFAPCKQQVGRGDAEVRAFLSGFDECRALYNVKLLRALCLFDLWTLPPPEPGADYWHCALPSPPPGVIAPDTLAASFRAAILLAHTDKQVRALQGGEVTHTELNMRASRLLKARRTLQDHIATSKFTD
jgi:hypothetical protein